jgi:hypothetical protein
MSVQNRRIVNNDLIDRLDVLEYMDNYEEEIEVIEGIEEVEVIEVIEEVEEDKDRIAQEDEDREERENEEKKKKEFVKFLEGIVKNQEILASNSSDIQSIILQYSDLNRKLPNVFFHRPLRLNPYDYMTSTSSLYQEQYFTLVTEEFFDDYLKYIMSLKFDCEERIKAQKIFTTLGYVTDKFDCYHYDHDCGCSFHIFVGYEQYFNGDWCMGESNCNPSYCGCDCEYNMGPCNHNHRFGIETRDICMTRFEHHTDAEWCGSFLHRRKDLTIGDVENIKKSIRKTILMINEQEKLEEIQRKKENEEYHQRYLEQEKEREIREEKYNELINGKKIKVKCNIFFSILDEE